DLIAREEAYRRARLPDQALVQLRTRLDFLVRVDAHARIDDRLVADDHLVADLNTLVQARVRAHVAVSADDGTFDDRGAPNVRSPVDHRPRNARAFAQRDTRPEHAVRRNLRLLSDATVGTDERRPVDVTERLDLHPVADPQIPAQANPGDVQAHL